MIKITSIQQNSNFNEASMSRRIKQVRISLLVVLPPTRTSWEWLVCCKVIYTWFFVKYEIIITLRQTSLWALVSLSLTQAEDRLPGSSQTSHVYVWRFQLPAQHQRCHRGMKLSYLDWHSVIPKDWTWNNFCWYNKVLTVKWKGGVPIKTNPEVILI